MVEIKKLDKTPFYYWQCDIDSPNLKLVSSSCESDFFVYRIKTIPKLQSSPNLSEDFISYIIKQKVFFEGLASTILGAEKFLKGSFELRLQNNPSLKIIETFIILKLSLLNNRIYDTEKYKQQFESLFPTDYELSEISDYDEIKKILSLNDKKIIEILKASKFLPIGKISSNAPIANQNLEFNEQKLMTCRIPYVPTIEPQIHDLKNFYKALQDCEDNVTVRFSIALAEIYNIEKIIAQSYENYISKGFHNPDGINYSSTFTKYITAENLFSIKIQVASLNVLKAKAIANIFCGQLSNTGLGSNIIYKSFSLEQFAKEANCDWSFCNHYYFDFWEYNNYIPAMEIKAFMNRLPYLYNNIEYLVPFRIPISLPDGLPGMITEPVKPFYQPNPINNDAESQFINLGKILGSERKFENQLDYKIPVNDLTKHGLIVGATGSGKTNTTLNFVKELTKKGIPFLLIEPVKSEYYDQLLPLFKKGELHRFNFKSPFNNDGTCNKEYLRFNPFIPVEGISAIQHISYLKSCFTAAFPMSGIMPLILEECIYNLYLDIFDEDERMLYNLKSSIDFKHDLDKSKLDERTNRDIRYLSIKGLMVEIEEYLNNEDLVTDNDRNEFGAYLNRRFKKLSKGLLGNSINPSLWKTLDDLDEKIENYILTIFSKPTIIELEGLSDNDEKALIMAFLLTYLFEYRQTKPSLNNVKDISGHVHITIIEEAHRLFSSGNQNSGGGDDGTATQDSKAKSISLFIDMLAEIRAKGEGIFIVEQIPTKLISEAIKNTNLKIMHRITSKDDRHYLGEAMNMNEQQKNFVTNLKTGDAIVFEEQLDNPVFIKMNKF